MVCGQFHLVQIEIYELGMDHFRVENETRNEWSRKQTSSGKTEKLTSYKVAYQVLYLKLGSTNSIQALLKCEGSAAGHSNSRFFKRTTFTGHLKGFF